MKTIVTKADWILVAKSPIYTDPDLSTKNCIFITNNDGSMRGDNQNGCIEPINAPVFYACRKNAPCSIKPALFTLTYPFAYIFHYPLINSLISKAFKGKKTLKTFDQMKI
jgi:hypothetical protein